MSHIKRGNGSFLFTLLMFRIWITDGLIGIHVHHYYNLHLLALQDNPLKQAFQKCKENCCRGTKSNKVGRLAEFLQEQVKPTFSAFIAGGIVYYTSIE